MKKRIIVSAVIFIILVLTSLAVYFDVVQIKKVCIKDNCFNVEIADEESEREYGLMNRTFLESGSGMLFVFDKPEKYSFWMKDTFIPLDIIWISKYKEIVAIKKDAQPCLVEECPIITPKSDSMYVLEIDSNLTEQLGISVGDLVRFK